MARFKLEQSKENLSSHSGLLLFGEVMSGSKIEEILNGIKLAEGKGEPEISHKDVVVSYVGLLGLGVSDYEAIEPFRADENGFKLFLDIERVPSCSTLRQRLDELAKLPEVEALLLSLKRESLSILQRKKAVISPTLRELVALDIDVSPFDNSKSHKEEVSRTYKGFDGYSPILAYVGAEGYLVNVELRPGKQHCQKETPDFLRETVSLARHLTDKPLLVRMDAGNDAIENIGIFIDAGIEFIIKRNLRKEDKQEWLARAKLCGEMSQPRKGKTVYRGDLSLKRTVTLNGVPTDRWLRCVFEVTERTISAQGQWLLTPDIEVDTYWVSLSDDHVDTVIQQYHHHGTSEQFHSELKGDIDLERLPSGKFKTNQLVLHCALLAYNNLRLIGQLANSCQDIPLRKPAQRRRIKTVIHNLIFIASKLVRHARQLKLAFGCHSPWFPVFRHVYQALLC